MLLDMNDICGLIDNDLAQLIHTVIVVLKIAIPVILIVLGMLDFGKGVTAKKEDEIISGRRIFIKRVISAILIFFVVTIVQLTINIFDDKNDTGESDIWTCANMILNGEVPEIAIINDNGNNGDNQPQQNKNLKTKDGLTCQTEKDVEEYNLCIDNTNYSKELPLLQDKKEVDFYRTFDQLKRINYIKQSMIEVNKENICGTIFRNRCSYNGTILWSTVSGTDNRDKYNWNDSLENIDQIKVEYSRCYYEFMEKEDISEENISAECHEIFEAFFK